MAPAGAPASGSSPRRSSSFGIGMALPETETLPYAPQGKACYWGGWGGSLVTLVVVAPV